MNVGIVLRRLSALLFITVIACTATSCGSSSTPNALSYCAMLPDSVGLYVGNPVTQMGYPIGTIDRIQPSASSVRVDFTLTEERRFPAAVKAVVRSTSILADRNLELVGNYDGGPTMNPGGCVPLDRSATPKSLSQVIGSANTFINGINPATSSNIGDVIKQLDQAAQNNGAGINHILTTSSRLLDNPDGPISDMSSIVGNLGVLTDSLIAMRQPMKEILYDAEATTPDLVRAIEGAHQMADGLPSIITMISDIEIHAGGELQLTLDTVADAMRIMTPHARGLASLLDPLPWFINGFANHINNREFVMSFRPPLYRIRSPNGPLVCHFMNLSMPGSCANVAGQPYGVDINLLQYVFLNATR
ncbi:Mammalian cell entry related domain protein [Mycolicibacterium rhodesiae JS60]|nr:Mammalian cell entry related domain protein [Mycolicibacterium rhodesiae JS60]